ncbi:Mitochondrial carrier protein RIM2 [Penicillium argentinense]|uniref:Mitochondrial carrier protein RIM2 n=1 Tax=Penicillium argentinense TaxID=1131581 RepID=A0A9W9JY78_9EURO|nr:Mitochondrial carrier protein RIM2 [Penicillium argentinense]KAJ5085726.1 Mitochondrial carrier protein RIM2 [Penicillium argentinense]
MQSSKIHGHPAEEASPLKAAQVPQKKSHDPWVHLLAGASGGFATAIATSPLDVLRTRLQSDFYQRPPSPSASSPNPPIVDPSKHTSHKTARIISNIYRAEGWRAFFRGLGPSLAGVVPATAIKFYVYGNCKRLGAQMLGLGEDSTLIHAQAAISAGIATSTATNPIWLIKTRLQLDKAQTSTGNRRYKNSLDCLRQVIRHEGLGGLYKGLSASYLGAAETALHLVLYERLKGILHKSLVSPDGTDTPTQKEITSWISTTGAAGSAKFAAALIAYPHEVIRTRLRQAPLENGRPKYTGLVQCFRLIAKEEGMAGLYGGLTPHMVRSIPSAIITLGVYEFVLRFVGTSA